MEPLLVSKPKLPPDFIDLSVGEPYVVRDALIKTFDLQNNFFQMPTDLEDMSYPHPSGYKPLVDYLEAVHGAPVIITNGAKQALGAVFYALYKMGKVNVSMRSPYWALIPPLAIMHNLSPVYSGFGDAVLSLAPNNPDCFMPDLKRLEADCTNNNVPLIHDGAYYTHTYLSRDTKLETIGDVQIFSVSKMFGLSGLRLGYAVCSNQTFYQHVLAYVEAMTVGASIASQKILFTLMNDIMAPKPGLVTEFEDVCYARLKANRNMLQNINPDILSVPEETANADGMFAWLKVGSKADFNKSKLHLVSGAAFGDVSHIRMNLAFSEAKMKEIINRLNGVA